MSNETATSPAAAIAAVGDEGTEQAPPRRKGGVLLYGVIGLVLAAAVGGGWMFAPRLPGWARFSHHEAKREAAAPVKVTVPLPAVVVNIGRPDSRRYLKIGVELGVPGVKEAKEVEERKSQVTDVLLTVLATMSIESFAGEDGRTALKKTLLAKIHEELGLESVSRVYFTEFVIQ